MSTTTLVEETLRGLPDSITLYIPWSANLNEASWWSNNSEFKYWFPIAQHTRRDCEVYIAKEVIADMESVLDADLELPESIDVVQEITLHRNGDISPQIGPGPDMQTWVAESGRSPTFDLDHFNREFSRYYAGLVAENRKHQ